nr:hypothetical protein [Vibrio parahaemolyticus]
MINFRPSKVNAAVIFCMLTTPAMAFANTGACIYEQGIDKIRDGMFEQQENGGWDKASILKVAEESSGIKYVDLVRQGKFNPAEEIRSRTGFSEFFEKVRGTIEDSQGKAMAAMAVAGIILDAYSFGDAIKSGNTEQIIWRGVGLDINLATIGASMLASEAVGPFLALPAWLFQHIESIYNISKDFDERHADITLANELQTRFRTTIDIFETLATTLKSQDGGRKILLDLFIEEWNSFSKIFYKSNVNLIKPYAAKQLALYGAAEATQYDFSQQIQQYFLDHGILSKVTGIPDQELPVEVSLSELMDILRVLKTQEHGGRIDIGPLTGFYMGEMVRDFHEKARDVILPFIDDMSKETFKHFTSQNIGPSLKENYWHVADSVEWELKAVTDYNQALEHRVAWLYFGENAMKMGLEKVREMDEEMVAKAFIVSLLITPWTAGSLTGPAIEHMLQQNFENEHAMLSALNSAVTNFVSVLTYNNISIYDENFFQNLLAKEHYVGQHTPDVLAFLESAATTIVQPLSDILIPAQIMAKEAVQKHYLDIFDIPAVEIPPYLKNELNNYIDRHEETLVEQVEQAYFDDNPLVRFKVTYNTPKWGTPLVYYQAIAGAERIFYGKIVTIIDELETRLATGSQVDSALRDAKYSLAVLSADMNDKVSTHGVPFAILPLSNSVIQLLMNTMTRVPTEMDNNKPPRCIDIEENGQWWALSQEFPMLTDATLRLTYQLTGANEVHFSNVDNAKNFDLWKDGAPNAIVNYKINEQPNGVKRRNDTFTYDLVVSLEDAPGRLAFRPFTTSHGNDNRIFTLTGVCQ